MAAPRELLCKIGPSILNCDLTEIYNESKRLLDSGADYLHLDVMDNRFVPNFTFGPPVVSCLRRRLPVTFFDMHMMVDNPEKMVEQMADAGATQYTFHIEATDDAGSLIRKIRETGMKVGVGLKPATSVEAVLPYIEDIDMVLIMTVEPGFGGQKFMSNMMPKVEFLRQKFQTLDIEVDGGVGPGTIDACSQAGANMIVSGTAVVNSTNPKSVISDMRTVANKGLAKYNIPSC